MNNRYFMMVLFVVIFYGTSISGAYSLGIKNAPAPKIPDPVVLNSTQFNPDRSQMLEIQQRIQSGEMSEDQVRGLRGRIQSGEISEDELQELRANFAGRPSAQTPKDLAGKSANRSLSGTIEIIDDNFISIDSVKGPVKIHVDDKTYLTTIVELAELRIGMQIDIVLENSNDNSLVAQSINVLK